MALRFMDSFDHYATAQILNKWTTSSSTPAITASGRFGQGLDMGGAANDQLSITLDAQATWTVGFAFNVASIPGGGIILWQFRDGTTSHCDVRVTASGNLTVTRNGTGLATGTAVISSSVWYHCQFKATIADAGTYEVKLNNVTDISGSGDTRNGANASADNHFIAPGLVTVVYDDVYICDGTGGAPTDTFLGDLRIEALFPNGNGNSSVLVGSDGNSTDNYLLVDETTSVSDADYVESSNVGDKDTYTYTNLTPTTGTVYGVQCVPRAAKTDAGVRSIVSVARLSGTETDSADKTLSTSYLYYRDIRETKPGGGSWSISDVNSAEFGVKVSA